MDSQSPKDLMDLFSNQSTTIYVLWNLYALVALGIVSLVQKMESSQRKMETNIILSFGFVCFAVANLLTILQVVQIQQAVINTLWNMQNPGDYVVLRQSLRIFRGSQIIGFHILLDICVLVAIWLGNLRQRFSHKT